MGNRFLSISVVMAANSRMGVLLVHNDGYKVYRLSEDCDHLVMNRIDSRGRKTAACAIT